MFSGFDAYKNMMKTDVVMVILATPPGFARFILKRPSKRASTSSWKKPVAADPPARAQGARCGKAAKEKSLAVAVGLQRRHERKYMATVKAIQGRRLRRHRSRAAYWNGTRPWNNGRQGDENRVALSSSHWYHFNWMCGDHIVEQHIHNLDVINWIMNGFPTKAQGQGGSRRAMFNEAKSGENLRSPHDRISPTATAPRC